MVEGNSEKQLKDIDDEKRTNFLMDVMEKH